MDSYTKHVSFLTTNSSWLKKQKKKNLNKHCNPDKESGNDKYQIAYEACPQTCKACEGEDEYSGDGDEQNGDEEDGDCEEDTNTEFQMKKKGKKLSQTCGWLKKQKNKNKAKICKSKKSTAREVVADLWMVKETKE